MLVREPRPPSAQGRERAFEPLSVIAYRCDCIHPLEAFESLELEQVEAKKSLIDGLAAAAPPRHAQDTWRVGVPCISSAW